MNSSGYHLEGDGQTGWTNQTLEQYLWIFCNYQQDNWYTLLLFVEFTYNNTLSATTRISPFFTNKGYHPHFTVHPKRDLASSCARDLVDNLNELHQELKSAISKAQLQYHTLGPYAYKSLLNLSLNLSAIFEIRTGKIFFISNRKSVISIYGSFLNFYLK